MSAKVWSSEAVGVPPVAMATATATAEIKAEVVSVACECCGLTEECTPAYVARVRERYSGWWVCGLCGEAVEDEMCRAGRRISTEEALGRHMSFSESFRATAPPINTAEHLIAALRQLLRRSLDSPWASRSNHGSPRRRSAEEGACAEASRLSALAQ